MHLAADSAPAPEDVLDVNIVEVVAPDEVVLANAPAAARVADDESLSVPRRRPVVARAPSLMPRYTNASGEMVPRASLAVLRHALARIAKRKARRQPKVERGRRERAIEIHEGLVRGTARTPRSLAIAAGADLPRPVPPPPARHRPRTMMGL